MIFGADNPIVTVVVTTYERPELFKRAISSVLSQSYTFIEIIVVEDGSNSAIKEWLTESLLSESVQYIRHAKTRGLAAARNTGLDRSRGEFVAFLDDDDSWLPKKIEKQVSLIKKSEKSCAIVYCGALLHTIEGELIYENKPKLKGDIRGAISERGLHTIPSSGLFRKSSLIEAGGFDADLQSHIDHDIWLKLATKKFSADYIDEALVNVYDHEHQRMTEMPNSRISSANIFCSKWLPTFRDWWGEEVARRYCKNFKSRVWGMLGWAFLRGNQRVSALRCFAASVVNQPIQRRHIFRFLAVLLGHSAYTLIRSMTMRFLR